ncbi:hypothetical protein HAX54_017954, partial [Datura stramonium]|nr:hypothetical protein [Datura stramonium]
VQWLKFAGEDEDDENEKGGNREKQREVQQRCRGRYWWCEGEWKRRGGRSDFLVDLRGDRGLRRGGDYDGL